MAQMAGLTPQAGQQPLVVSGVIQGFGTGISWIALTVVAFSTLPAAFRDEGASMFNLLRNVGSSIGISSIQTYVTSGTQVAQAQLAQSINPYGLDIHQPQIAAQLATSAGAAQLNAAVATQASWIAYLDAFRLMTIMLLLVIPLLLFVRRVKSARDARPVSLE